MSVNHRLKDRSLPTNYYTGGSMTTIEISVPILIKRSVGRSLLDRSLLWKVYA